LGNWLLWTWLTKYSWPCWAQMGTCSQMKVSKDPGTQSTSESVVASGPGSLPLSTWEHRRATTIPPLSQATRETCSRMPRCHPSSSQYPVRREGPKSQNVQYSPRVSELTRLFFHKPGFQEAWPLGYLSPWNNRSHKLSAVIPQYM
jgi:hypothetical protein